MLTAAGSRLQPLARPRGDALARGRDARRLGLATSSCATSQSGAVWSAGYQPTGGEPDSYEVDVRARIAPSSSAATATLDDDARGRRLGRGRRRGAPRLAGQQRPRGAREIELTSYAELVLAPPAADDAHPGLLEAVRPDRVPAGVRRAARDAAAARARRAARSGRRISRWSRARPSATPQYETDRARFLGRGRDVRDAARDRRRPAALRTRPAPCSTRSSRSAAASRLPPGSDRARRVLDGRRAVARASCSTSSTSTTTAAPSSAPRRWPGRRRRCSCATSASSADEARRLPAARRRRPLRRSGACGRRPRRSLRGARRAVRRSGRTASPATCRSSSCASTTSRTSSIVRQLLRAHEYWRMKRLAVDLVILNERAVVLRPGPADRDRDRGAQQPVAAAARRRAGARRASSCCGPT